MASSYKDALHCTGMEERATMVREQMSAAFNPYADAAARSRTPTDEMVVLLREMRDELRAMHEAFERRELFREYERLTGSRFRS